MPEFSTEFWVMIITYLMTFAIQWGGTRQQIKNLTAKVEKHNNFAERMPVVEEQIKVINHRIQDLERKV